MISRTSQKHSSLRGAAPHGFGVVPPMYSPLPARALLHSQYDGAVVFSVVYFKCIDRCSRGLRSSLELWFVYRVPHTVARSSREHLRKAGYFGLIKTSHHPRDYLRMIWYVFSLIFWGCFLVFEHRSQTYCIVHAQNTRKHHGNSL